MSTRKNSLIEDVNVRNTHVADLGTDELFDRIDGDGSGQIDKEEFNKLYAAIKADTEKEVRACGGAQFGDVAVAGADVFRLQVLELRVHVGEALLGGHAGGL